MARWDPILVATRVMLCVHAKFQVLRKIGSNIILFSFILASHIHRKIVAQVAKYFVVIFWLLNHI